jgi:hypothetical protein
MTQTKQIAKIPLTSEMVDKYLDGNANIVMLRDFPSKYETLDEAFNETNHIILFTSTQSPTVGHWQLIYKNMKDEIHFFDSYGMKPHEILQYVIDKTGNSFGQNFHLSALLREAHCHYNEHKYQADGDIQTCGRYVILNLMLKFIIENHANIPYDGSVFYKIMQNWKNRFNTSYDAIVSKMIDKISADEE